MKAVLFDLDGTLLDRSESLKKFIHWQLNNMLKDSITDTEKFISRFIELDNNGSVWKDLVYATLITEFSISNWTIQELLTSYEIKFCNFSTPKQGVIKTIKTLHDMGVKLALVSNGKSPFQERNFNALGISTVFDAVIISEAVGLRKPDKAIFNLACSVLKTKASHSIFVGDSIKHDIKGANNAGLYSVYISEQSSPVCDCANSICKNFEDLPDIVLAAN